MKQRLHHHKCQRCKQQFKCDKQHALVTKRKCFLCDNCYKETHRPPKPEPPKPTVKRVWKRSEYELRTKSQDQDVTCKVVITQTVTSWIQDYQQSEKDKLQDARDFKAS